MIKINQSGRMLDVNEAPPKFMPIYEATKADLQRPVSFLHCEGRFMDRVAFLLDLLRSNSVDFVLAGSLNALLKMDEEITAKPRHKQFTIAYPLQGFVNYPMKLELEGLYGLALHWHWVTGSNYIFILENSNLYTHAI